MFKKSKKNTQQPAVASTNGTSTNNNSTTSNNSIPVANIAAPSTQAAGISSASGSNLTYKSSGVFGYGSSSGAGIYGSIGTGGLTASSINIGGIYSNQSPYTWSSSAPSFGNDKYSILKLPHETLPEAVFVSGRMITFGAFGSDAECVFVGDALIFAPQVLTAITFNNKITIILQYANKMFHYSVPQAYGMITYKENSRILNATLLSETQRGQTV